MSKTLHYDFATDKSLVAKVGPTLSLTRATTATYVGSDGLIKSAASGEARFTHDKDGNSRGLLIEEARTNIAVQSQTFGTSPWAPDVDAVINTDVATAPDGTTTADQLIDDASTGGSFIYVSASQALSTSTVYVLSCFMKQDGKSWGYLNMASLGALAISAYYDLANGVVGATVGADVDDTGIDDYGNGWYRCWLTFTSDSTDTFGNLRAYVADGDGDISVERDGTASILLWGMQVEAPTNNSKSPSSYIPTTTVSVTRDADEIETTDVTWYNSTEGTLYSQASISLANATGYIASMSSDANANRWLQIISSGDLNSFVSSGGATQVSAVSTNGEFENDVLARSAFALAANDAEVYSQGVQIFTDTSVVMPVGISVLHVGKALNDSTHLNGTIAELAYFDERLDSATLQDYSTNGLPSDVRARARALGLGFGVNA